MNTGILKKNRYELLRDFVTEPRMPLLRLRQRRITGQLALSYETGTTTLQRSGLAGRQVFQLSLTRYITQKQNQGCWNLLQ